MVTVSPASSFSPERRTAWAVSPRTRGPIPSGVPVKMRSPACRGENPPTNSRICGTPRVICVTGASQWEPVAKYSPEAAKAEQVEWFGPTVAEFVKEYQAKYGNEEPSYHSAGGYAAGLILQEAIEKAGSIDTDKVKAALDQEDMYTFYGRIKFNTTPKAHGLQEGHQMIIIQWQKGPNGKPGKAAVWPEAAATGAAFVCQR